MNKRRFSNTKLFNKKWLVLHCITFISSVTMLAFYKRSYVTWSNQNYSLHFAIIYYRNAILSPAETSVSSRSTSGWTLHSSNRCSTSSHQMRFVQLLKISCLPPGSGRPNELSEPGDRQIQLQADLS